MTEPIEPSDVDTVSADLEAATAKELRRRYHLSYTSWREGRRICRQRKWKWHWGWDDFRRFLADMGPRGNPNRVLTRTDYRRPEYGPGLCTWTTRRDLLLRRPGTILLRGENGEVLPLVIWAERTHQPPDALRYRRSLGWKDEEVISGVREIDLLLRELRRKIENANRGLMGRHRRSSP